MEFKAYTDCLLSAFVHHTRQSDVVKRKKEIIGGVGEFYNIAPDTILYIGFSPAILVEQAAKIYVTEVSENVLAYLTEQKINVKHKNKSTLIYPL